MPLPLLLSIEPIIDHLYGRYIRYLCIFTTTFFFTYDYMYQKDIDPKYLNLSFNIFKGLVNTIIAIFNIKVADMRVRSAEL